MGFDGRILRLEAVKPGRQRRPPWRVAPRIGNFTQQGTTLMRHKALILGTVITALSLFGTYAGPAQAADPDPTRKLSGTIDIHSTQVAFLVSGKLGGGTLKFNGEQHHFNIGGMGIGGIGVQTLDAVGAVYNLTDIEKFYGTYFEARAGATVGLGAGWMSLTNTYGTIIDVKFSGKGVALSLGADGMVISKK